MREKNWMHDKHASDNAAFDVHQTDPARLSNGNRVEETSAGKFKVVFDGQSHGVFETKRQAEEALKKYVQKYKMSLKKELKRIK